MKVLIVTETLYEGGAEIFMLRLARAITANGNQATVLLLNKNKCNLRILSQFPDVRVEGFALPFAFVFEIIDRLLFKLGLDFSVKNLFYLKKLQKKIKNFDIVHSHYIKVDYLLCLLKRRINFRHVVTVHGDYSSQYYNHQKYGSSIWRSMSDKITTLRDSVDKWVLISEEQIYFFINVINVDKGKIIKIWNGFSLNKKTEEDSKNYFISKNHFNICMAGRGVKEKGWELAIEAMKLLPDDCDLYLIGDSSYLRSLKKKTIHERRIFFVGFLENPSVFIEKCDVLIMPTLFPYESLPNIIIESLSVGIPVIATNTGEIKKMITDEESSSKAGLLLEMIDGKIEIKHISERILELYYEREKLFNMKKVARIVSLKFSMENCVNSYLQAYKNLL